MPDPILYLNASLAALVASAMVVLVFRLCMRKALHKVADVVAVSAGVMIGYGVLRFSWTWLPVNALDRFLLIVLPATIVLESLTAVAEDSDSTLRQISHHKNSSEKARYFFNAGPCLRMLLIALRLALYASVGRILLHGSVYLSGTGNGNPDAWTFMQTIAIFVGSFIGLIAAWSLLCRLSERFATGSIVFSLAMAIQCTGMATMMAGYIKGGAAAIPLSAAIAGTSLAASLLASGTGGSVKGSLQGTIGIGVVGLFSLLYIGHYFGQLTTLRAIILFLTPLLCWVSEFPGLRGRPPWQKSTVRLIAVAIPLAGVLFVAKQDFDRKMAPLLAAVAVPDTE